MKVGRKITSLLVAAAAAVMFSVAACSHDNDQGTNTGDQTGTAPVVQTPGSSSMPATGSQPPTDATNPAGQNNPTGEPTPAGGANTGGE